MNCSRLLFIFCLFFSVFASAQDFSNKGKEFWIAYPSHIDGTNSVMGLYITSSVNANVTIQVGASTNTVAVTANQVKRYFIGSTATMDANSSSVYLDQADGVKTGAAIKVTSDNPIVVYAHIIRSARSGATLVLPTPVLGTTYITTGMSSVSTSQPTSNGSTGGQSEFAVVATQDNTVIEVTLTASGGSNRSVGNVYTVPLPNAGDVYQFRSSNLGDVSGTKIRSIASGPSGCKPIAVFAGSTWSALDCSGASGGDNLYQQMFPMRSWGKQFVTAPFINRLSDIYRIYVDDPATTVNIQESGTSFTLSASSYNSVGKYYTYKTSLPLVITASAPVTVAQFITSQTCKTGCTTNTTNQGCYADPEMVILNPVEQTLGDVTFFSAHANYVPSGQTAVVLHFVNIIINKNFKNSVKIDNAPPVASFIDIPNTNYAYLQENLTVSSASNPIHRVTADTGFSAIVYGYGQVESYGYNGGTNVIDLNPPITIQNQFSSTNISYSATCSNSPFKINLSLTYQPTQIVVDFNNNGSLVGPSTFTYTPSGSPGYDSTYISNGKTYYLYRIPQVYTFNASGTYPVKLTTTSNTVQSDGCSNTNTQDFTDNVVVNAPPTADFTVSSNGCINTAIALTDASDGLGRPIIKWNWEFSDATTATVQNPSKTFSTGGNYTAKLTSITDFGCIATATKNINVSAKPVASFTVPTLLCEKSSIVFTNTSTIEAGTAGNTITRYNWNLDNGGGFADVTTNASQSTTYSAWGNKDVRLVAESNTGCLSDTFRLSPQFKINPLPQIGFVLPEVCLADANAPFTDTTSIADGSQASFTYLWKFNDGSNPVSPGPTVVAGMTTQKNPAPKYNKADNYTVTLTVTSNNGCVSTLSKPFTVNGSIPNSKFVEQLTPICVNDSVRITNTSTVDFGTITRLDIYWDTLNAPLTKVRDEDPTFNKVYATKYSAFASAASPANKSITIALVAASGQSSVCSRSFKKVIILNNSPAVSFVKPRDICNEAAPRQISQGTFVSAVSTNTAVYSGTGINSAGLYSPQTLAAGTYALKYKVTNSAGCTDSAAQSITVWPSPVAKWGVQAILCEKNNIAFTDSSVANFSNIAQRKWNYGDGVNETRTSVTSFNRVYPTAQTYNVSLQVITDSGCVSPINQQAIKVNPLPQPAFTLPTVVCLPDGRASFTNQSTIADASESLFSYLWNFGDPSDATPSLLKEPTHKYSAVGPVNVKLSITSKDGCKDSLTKSFNNIYPWPKAHLGMNVSTACVGDTVYFMDNGNGMSSSAASWRWDLGQGFSSTLKNPSRQFNDSGTYTISYYFFNAQGCVSDTVSKNLIVYPYPKLTLPKRVNVLEGGNLKIKPIYYYGTNLSYMWTPPTYLNDPTDSTPVTTPLGDITYKLYLTGIGGCTVSDTMFVKLLLSPIVPNAFSPNGDGINDRWRIQYLESYPGATVDVYNRYGQLVFSSIEYSVDWDGTVNGKPLPIGTYYYVINPKNGRKIISGSVTIIR